jgi:hypothetical protein
MHRAMLLPAAGRGDGPPAQRHAVSRAFRKLQGARAYGPDVIPLDPVGIACALAVVVVVELYWRRRRRR